MTEWQKLYCERLMSAAKAVASIRSGQCIFIGSNGAEPQTLVEALTARSDQLDDTEIVHILTLGTAPYSEARFENHFRHNAFFIGANVREAVNTCRADYTPIFLSEIPGLFRSGQVALDYALIMVSPPDAHGYCSLGIGVDIVKSATECAHHIVAEVNPWMPRTHGVGFLHVSRIDAFVESNRPLLELTPPVQSNVTGRIGHYIAELIEDGSVLQMGIGAIPDAVLHCLGGKRDLGIHTEMFSDGLIPLIEAHIVNGRRKSLHPGKIITSFCMGTRALYDFVDNNPAIEFHPSEYVNDPFVIAQNEKMVAINAAIEVDLTGQVCADSIGAKFYSGIGGQVDFLRGAARSRGGKPIIALPSTATLRNGTIISRIVSMLKPGAGVVTSRGDVHYVVTEWGVAFLHGKSIRERALALIRIAHPDFRAELLAAAKERALVSSDQTDISLQHRYPEELETRTTLSDGTVLRVRPIRCTDEDRLRNFHYRLSQDTVYRRYGQFQLALPHPDRLKLVDIDYVREMTLVALNSRETEAQEEIIGLAQYSLDEQTRFAEIAFTVRDDWHDKGIGTLLMEQLIEVGRQRKLGGLTARVQTDNVVMNEMLLRHDFRETSAPGGDIRRFRLPFADEAETEPKREFVQETRI